MTGAAGDVVLPGSTRDLLGEPFRLDSISEVPAPEGAEGLWQQYVIVQGTNTIKGLRAGTHAEVNLQVESMVERLNERFRKSQTGLAGSTGRKPPPRVGRQDAAARTPPAAVVTAPVVPTPSDTTSTIDSTSLSQSKSS